MELEISDTLFDGVVGGKDGNNIEKDIMEAEVSEREIGQDVNEY